MTSALLTGCGGGDPFRYIKVSGKVTFEDGSPIRAEQVKVFFVPQSPPLDEKTYPRDGIAEVNVSDGTFSLATSHKYGDGIVPGTHKVLITAYGPEDASNAVPAIYSKIETTPIEIDAKDTPFHFTIARQTEQE